MAEHLQSLRKRISDAEKRFGRNPGSVRLLAASKARSVEQIRRLAASGQWAFGENYLQEALDKMRELNDPRLEWHYIGQVQTRKIPHLASHFAWLQSLASQSVAEKLDRRREPELGPLQVCIQVNISDELGKGGCQPGEVEPLARLVAQLPNLRLRGIMVIPAPEPAMARQRTAFRRAREIHAELERAGFALDTLSMGMSADLEAAIAEGSTMVRIGTALFGPRRTGPREA